MQRNTTLKRFASCSIGISSQASGVRKFNVSAVDFGYSFATSNTKMTSSAFEYDFGPAASQYFPSQFGPSSSATSPAPFNSCVDDWDKATGADVGQGVIGNTWGNLQIRSRATSGIDWVSALLDAASVPDYMAMSRAMQNAIRKYLLVAYGDNASQFGNVPGKNMVSAFLVYTALPGLNDFTFDGSTLKPNPRGHIVWDVRDPELATAVTLAFAGPLLRQNLSKIAAFLAGIPELKSSAQFYRNADAQILGFVLQNLQTTDPYITLLQNEKAVIDGAKDAFESFRQLGGKQLQPALPQFSAALVNLVTDFNRSLMSLNLNASQVMRLFVPLAFGAAIDAMFAGAAPVPQGCADGRCGA